MALLRRFLTFLTILSLGLTTAGFGTAIGQVAGAGEVAICTGHGVVTLSLDAEGNPVERQMLCPDAALALLAATACPPVDAAPRDVHLTWRVAPVADMTPAVQTSLPVRARGPPGRGHTA